MFGNRITRRGFVRGAAIVGAGLGLLPATALSVRAGVSPKKGGRVRIGMGDGSTTDTLDPGKVDNNFTTLVNFTSRNCLTEIDGNGKLVPELAENWDHSSGATRWSFLLRKGVEFHNGKSLNAKDIVASINHHRGKDTTSAVAPLAKQIVDVTTDGNDRVVFTLESGNADFPAILSDVHFAILPSDDAGVVDWSSGIGTGGYKIEKFDPGVRSSLTRNANYWKPNAAHFDSAEILTILDSSARTSALKSGTLDVMDRCDLKSLQYLEKDPSLTIAEVSGDAHYTLPMRTDTTPFSDNNVRLALKFAMDREALLQLILRGHGTIGNDHPIGRQNPYFNAALEQRHYDPDKAKFYLRKAGASSLKVSLSVSDAAFAGAVDAAMVYCEAAKKAGIEIDVHREPADGYWSNVWMKKPWCLSFWSGRPTADSMFSTAYGADAPWNETFWKDAEFNKILLEARSETDEAKRGEMYADMQTIVNERGGSVIPLFNNYVFATRNVGRGAMAGNFSLDGCKCVERWWFT